MSDAAKAPLKPAGRGRNLELSDALKAYKGVWVFIEHERGQVHSVSWELLGEGRKLADQLGVTLSGVLLGGNDEPLDQFAKEAFGFGADHVYITRDPVLKGYRNEPFTKGLTDLVNKYQPEIVLLGATSQGRDLAGSVATTRPTGLTADRPRLNLHPVPRAGSTRQRAAGDRPHGPPQSSPRALRTHQLHGTAHAIGPRKDQGTLQFVLNKMKALQPYCFETFQKMHKAGVNIALGTDMGFDPEMGTNAREMEIYVTLGMTPMEAIMSATRNAARAIKLDKQLGTIEAGKLADIIAVKGDPLKNIRLFQDKKNIEMVMKEGRIYADRRPGHDKNVVSVTPRDWKKIDYL